MNMLDAGQLACMVSVRACPCAAMPCSAPASNSAPASASRFDPVFGLRMVLLLSQPMLLGGRGHFKGHANIRPAYQRGPTVTDEPRKKRTITEIRESKRNGEKMVYTSVLH